MTTEKEKINWLRIGIMLIVFIVLVPFLPLLISGRWDWWEAWVYALINILGFIVSRVLAARQHADLLRERARFLQHDDAKHWDKLLSPLLGLAGGLIVLIAGLDALWGDDTLFSLNVKIGALILILLGHVISSWALIENRFFSGVVRIQTERGHQVVTTGPYRWVRHPGYAGALLTYLFTPVFLDSWWTYIPVFLTVVLLVIRTSLEDKTLQDELAGYRNYAARTRYRLLPGVW